MIHPEITPDTESANGTISKPDPKVTRSAPVEDQNADMDTTTAAPNAETALTKNDTDAPVASTTDMSDTTTEVTSKDSKSPKVRWCQFGLLLLSNC